jgi:hypothetical protein
MCNAQALYSLNQGAKKVAGKIQKAHRNIIMSHSRRRMENQIII